MKLTTLSNDASRINEYLEGIMKSHEWEESMVPKFDSKPLPSIREGFKCVNCGCFMENGSNIVFNSSGLNQFRKCDRIIVDLVMGR